LLIRRHHPGPSDGAFATLNFHLFDTPAFVAYFLVVGIVAVVASRREHVAADSFLTGQQLHWSLIGISLIATPLESADSRIRMTDPQSWPGGDES
jgi:hypothetical protein